MPAAPFCFSCACNALPSRGINKVNTGPKPGIMYTFQQEVPAIAVQQPNVAAPLERPDSSRPIL